jgi:Na+-transporting methylmalonyl-CoA/oxaloacetate decarboxylase gamma subunit
MAMAEKFESEVILLQVVTPVSRLVARMVPGQVTPATTVQIGAEVARDRSRRSWLAPAMSPGAIESFA